MTVTSTETTETIAAKAAPLVIVSCDTHIGPRLREDLRPYCPKGVLDDFDAQADELAARQRAAQEANGRVSFGGSTMGSDWGVRFANLQTPGHFDMHARLRDLDEDGVAAEVIFHDSQNGHPIPFQVDTLFVRGTGEGQDFEKLAVGRHIYNQWLADVCSIEPERHIGLMQLPMWDIEAAVQELEWGRSVGLKGANFPYPRSFMPPYTDPAWAPFWSACDDLGITLACHGGAGATGGMFPGSLSVAAFEIATLARICPMDHLIFGGVFERHPGLRLVSTEAPGLWWRYVLHEMDSIYRTDCVSYGPNEKLRVPRLPSDYASEHVWIGASFQARFEAEDAIANGYADRVIWGSDYPHFEGTYQYDALGPNGEPMTWASMRFTYGGLPFDDVRAMVGGNAAMAYDFDLDALADVAARINAPSYDDLTDVKVEERPKDGGHLAFRTFGFFN
jgi:predicted TIM-barrel fold metal-dependent hydrolase